MRPLALGLRAPYRLKRTIALLAQATLNLDFTRGGPIDSRVTFSRASGGTSFRPVSYGPNLVTNGDFSAGATGWHTFSGTVAVSGGTLTGVTSAVSNEFGTTNIAVTANKLYLLEWDVVAQAAPTTVYIHNPTYDPAMNPAASTALGRRSHLFVAKATGTAMVNVVGGGANSSGTFDNFAVREVTLDRPGDPIQLVTVPAHVPRFDYDPVSRLCKGLLVEEQRTNLVTHSHEFDNAAWSKNAATVVPNAAVAPDGTLTADKIIATSANTQHYVFGGGASIAANSTGTLSIYAKAAEQSSIAFSASGSGAFTAIFDLAAGSVSYQAGGTAGMSPVGNGWYRCWFTCTTTAFAFVPYLFPNTSNSYAGDGVSGVFVWGGQHESGAFHTSHIPTSGAAATRALEQPVVNTLSPWYNVAEGTLLVDVASSKATATQYAAAAALVGSAATVNYVVPSFNTLNTGTHITGGSTMVQSAVVSGPAAKIAIGLAPASQSMVVNGGAVVTRAVSAPLNLMTALRIGYWEGNPGQLNGHIRRVAFWPRRMSNLDLQGLTR